MILGPHQLRKSSPDAFSDPSCNFNSMPCCKTRSRWDISSLILHIGKRAPIFFEIEIVDWDFFYLLSFMDNLVRKASIFRQVFQ